MSIHIDHTHSEFEREPMARPFGFKGGYVKEIWQTAALLRSDRIHGLGVGSQSVLWSDQRVFASASESAGNSLMFAITDKALQIARGKSFETPVDLLTSLLPETLDYARKITGLPDLRKTFVLNALVAVDNAAWLLYARKNGIDSFDDMIPMDYRHPLSCRHDRIASIPIASYGTPPDEVEKLVHEEGYFMIKFKLGSPGTQEEMLARDMQSIQEIHKRIGNKKVDHTSDGKLPYYFDPNGRYEHKDTLQKLLDFTKKIGAFDQILILEEPFPEEYRVNVGDLGVTVAADESAHTAENVAERIEMGYGAIALKPIAKTLSMTLKMAKVAYENNIPCFCADLTVNPVLAEWNRNVACRLAPLPGLEIGLMEANGHQNYKKWPTMMNYHPCPDASWLTADQGVFRLNDDFYKKSGGILIDSTHYYSILEDGI